MRPPAGAIARSPTPQRAAAVQNATPQRNAALFHSQHSRGDPQGLGLRDGSRLPTSAKPLTIRSRSRVEPQPAGARKRIADEHAPPIPTSRARRAVGREGVEVVPLAWSARQHMSAISHRRGPSPLPQLALAPVAVHLDQDVRALVGPVGLHRSELRGVLIAGAEFAVGLGVEVLGDVGRPISLTGNDDKASRPSTRDGGRGPSVLKAEGLEPSGAGQEDERAGLGRELVDAPPTAHEEL
jgi:hypothetical protein